MQQVCRTEGGREGEGGGQVRGRERREGGDITTVIATFLMAFLAGLLIDRFVIR